MYRDIHAWMILMRLLPVFCVEHDVSKLNELVHAFAVIAKQRQSTAPTERSERERPHEKASENAVSIS